MSQTKLGTAVGLTFQQIQKYERGANRMGASRLFEFAKVLDVPVSHFFEEMPASALARQPLSVRGRKGFGETGTPLEQEKRSADQARDSRAGAGLLQDSIGGSARGRGEDDQSHRGGCLCARCEEEAQDTDRATINVLATREMRRGANSRRPVSTVKPVQLWRRLP
jgi:transcriptional regulator with XRE-family HTH domain